jgi:CO/xanthine dehydrogenase FAD-binding subunit
VAGDAAMKPAPFAYQPAHSIPQALALLEQEDALALAGGQSLVPMLNFRFARPSVLVDLNPIPELSYVWSSGGGLRIGAMTRQSALERSELASVGWPLLVEAVGHVAHPAIRNRGTIGGSVAQADPKAELPVALAALDARFHVRSARGSRTLSAAEMFLGPMVTALAPGELLSEIELPAPPAGARMAFVEYSRTHGDFALAGAAIVVAPGGHAAVALLGAGPAPVRATDCERAVAAGVAASEAAEFAGALVTDDFQRALVTTLVARGLERVQS